jgi:hypothetical protein
LIVAVGGLAVGAIIGGKTTTRVVTITGTAHLAAQTTPRTPTTGSAGHAAGAIDHAASTTAATTSASSPAGTGTSTTATSTGSTPAAKTLTPGEQVYYSAYLGEQNTTQLNANATNVQLDSSPDTRQLDGQTYNDAIAFDLSACCNSAQTELYQLPVPGFSRFTSPRIGLETNASANASYKLTVYANNMNAGSPILFTGTFNGPSETRPMSFATGGLTDLVFDWTEPSGGEPNNDGAKFIVADPKVTAG